MAFLAALLLFLLPLQWSIPLGEVLGDAPLFRLGALILLFGFGIQLLLNRSRGALLLGLTLPLVGLLGTVLLGLLITPTLFGDWERKLLFLLGLLPLTLVWWWLVQQGKTRLLIQATLWGASISAGIGLLIFLAQFLFGVERVLTWLTMTLLPWFLGERLHSLVTQFPSFLVEINGEAWLRATGLFPDPHVAAFFYGITGWLSVALFLETRLRRWLFIAFLLFVTQLLTFSRGGYLGLVASFGIFTWLVLPRPLRFPKWTLAMIGLLPILLIIAWPILERLLSSFLLEDASSTDRLVLWQTAWHTWSQYPFFGVGLGQYAETILPFLGNTVPYYAHNLYLDIGVELGWIGLLFWLWLLIGAWWRAVTIWRTHRSPLALVVASALALYMVHSLFETALFSFQVTALLTLLLALAHTTPLRKPAQSGLQ